MESSNNTDNFWIHESVQKKYKCYTISITPKGIDVEIDRVGWIREESFNTIEAAFDYMESLRSTKCKVPRKVQRKLRAGINKQMREVDFKAARQILADRFEKKTKYLMMLEDYINSSEGCINEI